MLNFDQNLLHLDETLQEIMGLTTLFSRDFLTLEFWKKEREKSVPNLWNISHIFR